MHSLRYRRAAAGVVLSLLAAALLVESTQAPAFAQTTSATRQGAHPTTLSTTQVSLHFQDVFLNAVLTELSRDYGFEIPIDEAPRDLRVSLISEKPIPPEEAISLLNIALKPKGYTAILSGRVLKVMERSKVKRQNIPVYIGNDPDKIADNDDLITQVIPLRSLDAVKLRQDLTPLISSDADVASNAASNSLIITDSSSNIRRIVKIVYDLDQHQAGASDLKVVQLSHADAESAAKLVMTIFRPDLNQQGGQNQQGPPFGGGFRGGGGAFFIGPPAGPGGPGGAPPGMSIGGPNAANSADQGANGKINAASDQRTNTVVVTGPPETVKVVIDMLHEIDNNPASQQTFFLYRLKNADATNLQGVLNSLFGTGTASTNSNNNRNGTNRLSYTSTPSSGSGNRSGGGQGGGGFGGGGGGLGGPGGGFGGSGVGFGGGGGAFGGGGGFGGGGLGGGSSSSGQRGSSDIAGQVYVVADTYTNSLLVETATRFEQQVRQVIAELDRPVPQVLIKVLVAEVTHDNNADFGVDYSILNTRPNGLGQSYSQSFGAPTGGLVVGLIEDKINATLHALAQQNKLDVLSRPYILASDNQEAYVLIGQEVPIVQSNTTTALGQTVSNYNYQSVGVILDVIPHINPDGLVTLQVSPQISQLTAQTVTVGPGVSVPVIASRTAISQVAIKDGQTIVIGGLMQDQKTLTVNKVPILGDIPILKYAFSRTQVDKTKTELLIFLTPHVAPQPDLLKPMSKDELKGTRLTPNAVEPGTFDEHLRGMERGTALPYSSAEGGEERGG